MFKDLENHGDNKLGNKINPKTTFGIQLTNGHRILDVGNDD